jgi:hypothetical protein
MTDAGATMNREEIAAFWASLKKLQLAGINGAGMRFGLVCRFV